MKTLEEAITHCVEKAAELKESAYTDFDSWTETGKVMADECLERANEHEQLAEWLKELKALKEKPTGDLISRSALRKEVTERVNYTTVDGHIAYDKMLELIDNAPTVEPEKIAVANVTFDKEQLEEIVEKAKAEVLAEVLAANGRPQGGWVRKEDVIYSIAKQYTEHNEVVPNWLSIGDMKGGAV